MPLAAVPPVQTLLLPAFCVPWRPRCSALSRTLWALPLPTHLLSSLHLLLTPPPASLTSGGSVPSGLATAVIPSKEHGVPSTARRALRCLIPNLQPFPWLLPALSGAKRLSVFFLIVKFLTSEPLGLLESGLPDGWGGDSRISNVSGSFL